MVKLLQHGHNISTWTRQFSIVKLLPYMNKLLTHGQTIVAWTYCCCMDKLLQNCHTIPLLHAHNIITAWPNYCCIAKLLQHGHTISAPQKNRMTRILQHGHNIVTWSYLYSMVKRSNPLCTYTLYCVPYKCLLAY
jgi:hypothetical protein